MPQGNADLVMAFVLFCCVYVLVAAFMEAFGDGDEQ